MRRFIFILAWHFCATASGLALDPEWVGKTAPEFTLKTLDGKRSVSLSDFRGQVVVIDFWASWCAPCKRSLPQLDAMETSMKNVVILAVNVDDERRNGMEFLKQHRIQITALHDEGKDVATAYDVPAMPSALVLDKRGIVRFIHAGYTDGDIQEIKKQIQGLL
ncbi:MAG: TlpA family protein disulfide reductase [Bacteroidota bacterium]